MTPYTLEQWCRAKPPQRSTLALPDPCKIVTQQEAGQAAGTAVLPGATGTANIAGFGDGVACIFRDPGYPRAFVRIDAFDLGSAAAAGFTAYEQGSMLKIGEVPDLGDDNFIASVGPHSCSCAGRTSLNVFTIGRVDRIAGLARIAIGRL